MIISFGDKITENIFNGISNKKTRGYPQELIKIFERKLDFINGAFELIDLKSPPRNRLKKLKRDLEGFYSIRVNDQFRIIFKWHNHDALEVKITDYH